MNRNRLSRLSLLLLLGSTFVLYGCPDKAKTSKPHEHKAGEKHQDHEGKDHDHKEGEKHDDHSHDPKEKKSGG